jgi:hypothetical protein
VTEIRFWVDFVADEMGSQCRAHSVENGEILWVKIPAYAGDQREERRYKHYSELLSNAEQQKEKRFLGKCDNHTNPNEEITYCQAEMAYSLKAGGEIGIVGAERASGIDLGVSDQRVTAKLYVNPKHHRNSSVVCGLDLFDATTKAQLYAKLGRQEGEGDQAKFIPRTIEPKCGEVNQDKAGTALGNWITGEGMMDSPETWDKTIALVHDNFDPTLGTASIGGVISQAQKITFVPTYSGKVNREWSQVTPDNQIYCYDSSGNSPTHSLSANGPSSEQSYLLISLTDATHLNAEIGAGNCSNNPNFTHLTQYQR